MGELLGRTTVFCARNSERALVIGPLVACAGLLLHSLVDFNLHIPSNALMFLLLAVLATTRTTEASRFMPASVPYL